VKKTGSIEVVIQTREGDVEYCAIECQFFKVGASVKPCWACCRLPLLSEDNTELKYDGKYFKRSDRCLGIFGGLDLSDKKDSSE